MNISEDKLKTIEFSLKKENKCKGIFWRGTVSSYISIHNSIETRKSLRLLKRMSCTGCEQCDWIWDFIKEDMCNIDGDHLPTIENGKIYTYHVSSSQGYYDSYPEIDSFDFIQIKENK